MSIDEILTLRDILALRLENARLVVLSACETGVPGTDIPNGVISLPAGLEPPEALRQAQLWIRNTTNGEKAEYFKGFLPGFESQELLVHVADTLYKASILARPDENDFEHPLYWAALTYTGLYSGSSA